MPTTNPTFATILATLRAACPPPSQFPWRAVSFKPVMQELCVTDPVTGGTLKRMVPVMKTDANGALVLKNGKPQPLMERIYGEMNLAVASQVSCRCKESDVAAAVADLQARLTARGDQRKPVVLNDERSLFKTERDVADGMIQLTLALDSTI